VPRTLYKYVPAARIDILRNGCVCFTRPDVFNDVFELSPVWTGMADLQAMAALAPGHLRQARAQGTDQDIETFLAGVNEASVERGVIDLMRELFLPALHGGTGVLCLSERPDNLLMWSHYADQHRGLLLGFDGRHPFFEQRQSPDDEFHHVRRVRYAVERPRTTALGLLGPHTLLTKSEEWQYEQEWRMLVRFEHFPHHVVHERSGDVHLVPIPRSSITDVILGCRAARETVEAVVDLLASDHRYAHVTVRHASLDTQKFGLVFRPLGEHYLERGRALLERARRVHEMGLAEHDVVKQRRLAETAVEELDCAIRWAPSAEACMARGNAYALLNRQEDAAADFKRAVIMEPSLLLRMLQPLPEWKDILPGPAPAAPPAPARVRTRAPRGRPWETCEDLVARVVRYWERAGAAGLDVLQTIRVGDVLHVWGKHTDFVQPARSIERKRYTVREAPPGPRVGLAVDQPVAEGDEVYRVRIDDLRRQREAALWIVHEPRDTFLGIVQRSPRRSPDAAILLLQGRLSRGDVIRLRGRGTDVRQAVAAMHRGGTPARRVDATATVRVAVAGTVRPGDLVYKVKRPAKP
jgi:hypothetical protein